MLNAPVVSSRAASFVKPVTLLVVVSYPSLQNYPNFRLWPFSACRGIVILVV